MPSRYGAASKTRITIISGITMIRGVSFLYRITGTEDKKKRLPCSGSLLGLILQTFGFILVKTCG